MPASARSARSRAGSAGDGIFLARRLPTRRRHSPGRNPSSNTVNPGRTTTLARNPATPEPELDMRPKKTTIRDPVIMNTDLLHSARASALRTSNVAELQALVSQLEVACEAARVAAIQDLLKGPAGQRSDAKTAERDGGFADLFSALRRARTEIRRRNGLSHRMPEQTAKRRHGGPSQDSAKGRARTARAAV